LEQHFTQLRRSLADSGADPDEVIEDLRRHIDEEVAARQLTVVTEEDVGQLLARIGAPEQGAAASTPQPASAPRPSPEPGEWLLGFIADRPRRNRPIRHGNRPVGGCSSWGC